MLITSLFFLTAFKKDAAPVKVSVANTTAIKSDKGQRPVKVLVYLSEPSKEPVTVKYKTEDGSAKAGVDYVATNGEVIFKPGEVAKWISITIIGEVAADPDEDAIINYSPAIFNLMMEVAGAIMDGAKAYITILQQIAQNPSIIGVSGKQAIYEVIISFTGYISDPGTITDCNVRSNGVVVLYGFLSGPENVAEDDDVMYVGDLQMIIEIDICSIDRLPGTDKDRFCDMSINGTGKVYTELEIYDDRRGGYINIENKDGQFKKTVTGSCMTQIADVWAMVPNESIASVFNGNELPMLKQRTLKPGIYKSSGETGETVVEVLRKIK